MKKIILIAIVLIFIAVLIFDKPARNETPKAEEGVMCTQEALLCPDGSYVGRSGPQCSFAACPSQPEYKGKLIQQEGKFFLVTAAPTDDFQEVSYSLPLEIKISNVLGQIVGKQVVVTGSFKEGNTLVVDQLEEITTNANTVELSVGETKFLDGVRITLNKIVSDSRCPSDVQCIQAGSAIVNATLKSNTDTETVNLTLGAAAYGFDSYLVSVVDVKPVPVSTVTTKPVYKVTFRVVSR